jgi:sugar lactone lactonase YvrE
MRHLALSITALVIGWLLGPAPGALAAGCTIAGGGHGDGLLAREQAVRPVSVAADGAGNVLLFDALFGPVRRVDATTGQLSTLAEFAYRAETGFGAPYSGLAVDGIGRVYVAHEVVRRYDASTSEYTVVAGKTVVGNDNFTFCGENAPASEVCLRAADIVVAADGDLFIADDWNQRIWRIDAATGTALIEAGGQPGSCLNTDGPALNVCVRPTHLALDGGGNLFVYDESSQTVRRLDASTQTVTAVAGNGTFGECPDGVVATGACLPCHTAIAVDDDGNLYFTTAHGEAVGGTQETRYPARRVDASTGMLSTAGRVSGTVTPLPISCAGRYDPFDLAIAPDGTLLVAAATEGRVFRLDLATTDVTLVAGNGTVEYPLCGDGGAATNACLAPLALATDTTSTIFVGEATDARHEPRGLGRIRRVDPTGVVTTITGNGVAPFCPGGEQPCLGPPT